MILNDRTEAKEPEFHHKNPVLKVPGPAINLALVFLHQPKDQPLQPPELCRQPPRE